MKMPMYRMVVLVAATTLLAGCGPSSPQTAAPAGTGVLGGVPTTAPATPSPGPTAEDPVVLPDGRSPVFIKSVDVPGRTITFDLIEYYTNADAVREWKKDNPGAGEPPALNGHYIRNNNPKLRTLPVSTTAVVKLLNNDGDPTSAVAAFADMPGHVSLRILPYWLTVTKGQITLIEEQFEP